MCFIAQVKKCSLLFGLLIFNQNVSCLWAVWPGCLSSSMESLHLQGFRTLRLLVGEENFELKGGKRTWPVSLTNQRSKQIAETTPSSVDRDRFSLLKWWVQVSGDPSSQCPFSRWQGRVLRLWTSSAGDGTVTLQASPSVDTCWMCWCLHGVGNLAEISRRA